MAGDFLGVSEVEEDVGFGASVSDLANDFLCTLVIVDGIGGASVVMTGLDGLITNGKFCCVRWVRLSLSWWHRPLRLRGSVLQSDVALAGEPDDPHPDVDRLPPARPAPRRRTPMGSGLSAADPVGRAGQLGRAGADRRGGP